MYASIHFRFLAGLVLCHSSIVLGARAEHPPDDPAMSQVDQTPTSLAGSEATTQGAGPQILHEQGLFGQTIPHSGYIDPNRESDNGVDYNEGLTFARIRFTEAVFQCDGGPLDTTNIVLTETGGLTPPAVIAVTILEEAYFQVDWDRPLTLQEWTTIQVVGVCNGAGSAVPDMGNLGQDDDEPDRVDLGFLPADINQNGSVTPLDLLRFKQYVNGVATPRQGEIEMILDIDRSGAFDPLDLLSFKRLKFGIFPATQSWKITSMNSVRP